MALRPLPTQSSQRRKLRSIPRAQLFQGHGVDGFFAPGNIKCNFPFPKRLVYLAAGAKLNRACGYSSRSPDVVFRRIELLEFGREGSQVAKFQWGLPKSFKSATVYFTNHHIHAVIVGLSLKGFMGDETISPATRQISNLDRGNRGLHFRRRKLYVRSGIKSSIRGLKNLEPCLGEHSCSDKTDQRRPTLSLCHDVTDDLGA